jgi:hypothetical protein
MVTALLLFCPSVALAGFVTYIRSDRVADYVGIATIFPQALTPLSAEKRREVCAALADPLRSPGLHEQVGVGLASTHPHGVRATKGIA